MMLRFCYIKESKIILIEKPLDKSIKEQIKGLSHESKKFTGVQEWSIIINGLLEKQKDISIQECEDKYYLEQQIQQLQRMSVCNNFIQQNKISQQKYNYIIDQDEYTGRISYLNSDEYYLKLQQQQRQYNQQNQTYHNLILFSDNRNKLVSKIEKKKQQLEQEVFINKNIRNRQLTVEEQQSEEEYRIFAQNFLKQIEGKRLKENAKILENQQCRQKFEQNKREENKNEQQRKRQKIIREKNEMKLKKQIKYNERNCWEILQETFQINLKQINQKLQKISNKMIKIEQKAQNYIQKYEQIIEYQNQEQYQMKQIININFKNLQNNINISIDKKIKDMKQQIYQIKKQDNNNLQIIIKIILKYIISQIKIWSQQIYQSNQILQY